MDERLSLSSVGSLKSINSTPYNARPSRQSTIYRDNRDNSFDKTIFRSRMINMQCLADEELAKTV